MYGFVKRSGTVNVWPRKVIDLKNDIAVLLAALVVIGLIYSLGYQSGAGSVNERYSKLQGKVTQQEEEAAKRLKAMTDKRDAIQAKLDREFLRQEEKDAAAQVEIDRLASELEHRPVRVRIVTSASGSCGGSTAAEGAEDPAGGAGHADQAYGLLQPENTKRLRESLIEVEQLNAAYSSCRNTLLSRQETLREN